MTKLSSQKQSELIRSESMFATSSGFSLPEILMALGIFSLLAVSGMSVGVLLGQSTQYGEEAQSMLRVTSAIRERLKYGNLCTQSIGTASGLNQGNIGRSSLLAGTQQLEIRISGLGAGVLGNEDILRTGQTIPNAKLRIDDIRFVNVQNVVADTFVAEIQGSFSSLRGRAFRPTVIGFVQFNLTGPSATSSISNCGGTDSTVPMNICTGMNCSWQDTPTPGCFCETISSLCPPGEYPTQFLPTGPVCQRLGATCPAGEYLVSVGIGTNTCAPLPAAPPSACAAQVISNCNVNTVAHGSASGSCSAGYSGSCSYTCNNGAWTTPSFNSCVIAAPPPPVNGLCGGANSGTFANAAAANSAGLCSAGAASPASLAGAGPWNWSCVGSNGGTNVSCMASASAAGPVTWQMTGCYTYTSSVVAPVVTGPFTCTQVQIGDLGPLMAAPYVALPVAPPPDGTGCGTPGDVGYTSKSSYDPINFNTQVNVYHYRCQ